MFDLTKLSAAKLVLIHNAANPPVPAKKFESTPRGLERTLAALALAGMSADEAAVKAGLLTQPAAVVAEPLTLRAFEAVNLATGNVVPMRSLHDATRKVDGNPKAAAKKAAEKAAAPYKALREEAAKPARAPLARSGQARSNATLPEVVKALTSPTGATLTELTKVAEWTAPFELKNLRIAAAKRGFSFHHDGAAGAARRYFASFGQTPSKGA